MDKRPIPRRETGPDYGSIPPITVWLVGKQVYFNQDLQLELQRRNIICIKNVSFDSALTRAYLHLISDCVLLDMRDSESKAFELIDTIRSQALKDRQIPPTLIAMSPGADQASLKRIFMKQVDDFLLSSAAIDDVVRALVRGAALNRMRKKTLSGDLVHAAENVSQDLTHLDLKQQLKEVLSDCNYTEVVKAFEKKPYLPSVSI
ncbi:hypothetical protein CKO35_09785 [Ectothiorhodospira shaposhnikovii]|uniref:response regulator n=1 Tax=Ectothiorhodospira shaposhnikovii TaxID=1054 RepID=UPI0019087E7A|nr:response regulator [Ectothiorhodospira shaposhnikovii]MBK1673592.1 hypothetical protein [Ectothiorhodospira shaposhnikovii]